MMIMMSLGMRAVQSQVWQPALAKPKARAAADPQVKGRAFGAGASVAMLGASAFCCHRARGRRSVSNAGRVVVTGGCGYIGSHTVLELLKAEYEVLVLDNLSRSRSSSIDRVLALAAREHHLAASDVNRRLAFKQVDLCDVKMLEDVLAGVKECDAVLHFAGYKSVGESMQKPDMYWDNNVGGFVNLMHLLEKYQVSNRVLLSSSCTVYKPSSEKISEDSELQPTCPYGDTKLKQEQILQCKIEDGRNWNGCALRYFNPAGAHNSGLLGEVPHALSPCMFIPRLGQIALGQRPNLEIFGKDYDTVDGTAIRDYLHIEDVAEAHVAALEHLKKSQGFDAFNLGTGHGHTVLEVLSAFETVCGRKLPHIFSERRDGDAPFAVANPSRAHLVLGWRAHRSLSEILASHWEFVQQNPDGFD